MQKSMLPFLIAASLLAVSAHAQSPAPAQPSANALIVTSTGDSGPGTLREALLNALSNPGPDSILFNIPDSDPGFDPATGSWFITPSTFLPELLDETVIDGGSQRRFQGDRNPVGPEIFIDGKNLSSGSGFVIADARNCIISEVGIVNFHERGINIYGKKATENIIRGCFIGIDPTGTMAMSNKLDGILISMQAHHNWIGGPDKEDANFIGGSYADGIAMGATSFNVVENNFIGCGPKLDPVPNKWNGIRLFNNNDHHRIGPGNIIAFNKKHGIFLDGLGSTNGAHFNTITANSIFSNEQKGIALDAQSNEQIQAPVITGYSGGTVTGTALPDAHIEIYSDDEDEGKFFEGESATDATGAFTWTGPIRGRYVTATVTNGNGSTSEFSQPLLVTAAQPLRNAALSPRLYQNYPNPFRDRTDIAFELTTRSRVVLRISDVLGREVIKLVDNIMPAGMHSVTWNGADATGHLLPRGAYFCRMFTGNSARFIRMALTPALK